MQCVPIAKRRRLPDANLGPGRPSGVNITHGELDDDRIAQSPDEDHELYPIASHQSAWPPIANHGQPQQQIEHGHADDTALWQPAMDNGVESSQKTVHQQLYSAECEPIADHGKPSPPIRTRQTQPARPESRQSQSALPALDPLSPPSLMTHDDVIMTDAMPAHLMDGALT
jgi:cell division protein FtsN